MIKKVLFVIIGTILIALGISICTYTNLGIDPGMTFFYGMKNLFHLKLNIIIMIFNLLFLIPMLIFDSKRVGFGTLFNLIFVGVFVELFNEVIFSNKVVNGTRVMVWFILLIGIVIQCFGVALYSKAHLGQAPLDGLANIMITYTNKGNYQIYRMIQDCIFVVIGKLLDVKIGIGTLCFLFLVGFLIQFIECKLNNFYFFKIS